MKLNIECSKDLVSKINQLANDLNNPNVSSFSKDVLAAALMTTVCDLDKVICNLDMLEQSMSKTLKQYEDRIAEPEKRQAEFKQIAKQLNFPDLSPNTDDHSSSNPNINTSFEETIPDKDIEFINTYMENKSYDDVSDEAVLSSDEQLSDDEISTYTKLDDKLGLNVEIINEDVKLNTSTKSSKSRSKKTKTKAKRTKKTDKNTTEG